jgi:hypothetical protein
MRIPSPPQREMKVAQLDSMRVKSYVRGSLWHSINKSAKALKYRCFLSNTNAAPMRL